MKATKRQKYWLDIIYSKGALIKCYNNSRGIESYAIFNSSQEISKKMIKKLFEKNFLIPQEDGMFGDSQTYKAININALKKSLQKS